MMDKYTWEPKRFGGKIGTGGLIVGNITAHDEFGEGGVSLSDYFAREVDIAQLDILKDVINELTAEYDDRLDAFSKLGASA